ncbi:MAG: DUF1573 domain-containing protein [Flavobacteriales bacterium]|nr:DUF1573 domain-containing protein [Flavobacteriales bacterium]
MQGKGVEDSAVITSGADFTAPSLSANPSITQPPAPAPIIDNTPKTVIEFEEMEYDFGNVKQNTTDNEHVFTFTNTGDEPLIITNAKGSCGCTVPKYPKEPIAPGETGIIEVSYKPGTQKGSQAKTVTLTANTTPANTLLSIKAFVEEVAL